MSSFPNPCYGFSGYGFGGYGNEPIETLPIGYYQQLLTSEYRLSPKLNALLYVLLKKFDDVSQCLVQMDTAFDLDAAVGAQLDVLGQIVNVSRIVNFQPTPTPQISIDIADIQIVTYSPRTPSQWVGITVTATADVPTVETGTLLTFNGITDYTALDGVTLAWTGIPANEPDQIVLNWVGNPGTTYPNTPDTGTLSSPALNVSPVLDDDTYRLLIKARIGWNQWDGTIDGLYPIWDNLFPSGKIIIADAQNMTAEIIMSGSFTSIIKDLITHGYIVPRPEGVLYTYTFATLPIFGFDLDNSFIAGFDTGHFA